jgi:hypothetical protein
MRHDFTEWALHCTHHKAQSEIFPGGRQVFVRDRFGAVRRMRHGAGRGPGRERAVVGFGAGEPRGREGIGPALRGAEDCHRRSGRDGDRKLEAKFTYAAVASGKGSIEAVHDVIKNELAGGVMPCGRYGANAAWLQLAVLTYNVLTALKRLALPSELPPGGAQAAALSDLLHAGKIGPHARRTLLPLEWSWNRFSNWQYALRLLPLPAPC